MFSDYEESGAALLSGGIHKLHAKFSLTNTNVTIANTLRRAILTQVPTVGFRTEPYDKSDINVIANTTPLVNEMIVHRIGMIPINADPLTFDPEQYTFELDVENTSKEIRDVCAKDIKVFMRNPDNALDAPIQVDSALFFPPDPITGDTILITRLRPQWNPIAPNERLAFRARACISSGAENIRWSPVSQSSYEFTRSTDETRVNDVFNRWLANYKKVDDPSSLDATRRDELLAEFRTMEIQRAYVTDAAGNPNDFTFHVESIGIQSVAKIVDAALVSCDVLVSKYMDIDGKVPDNVRVVAGTSRFPSIDFWFTNEGHTLGNLLETWLIDNEVTDAPTATVTYAGYKVPHPLRPEMYVRVGVKEDSTPELQQQMARTAIAKACRALRQEFRDLRASWAALFGVADDGVAETKND